MVEQPGLFRHGDAEHMFGNGAIFSDDGVYRYRLWRIWNSDRHPTVFLMQNPSKAGCERNDITVSKCIGFARRWGAGGIVVVNPFAFVMTDTDELVAARDRGIDIVGPENDAHLKAAFAVADQVIVAWGGHAIVRAAATRTLAMITADTPVECLGYTREGHPRHPSRLGYATERVPFEVRA